MSFLKKKPWTRKDIRIVIGSMMASAFMVLVFQINHLMIVYRIAAEYNPVVQFTVMFNYGYITVFPTVILIALTYVLLMKVFPYQPKDKP